jgi:hypothetical protein
LKLFPTLDSFCPTSPATLKPKNLKFMRSTNQKPETKNQPINPFFSGTRSPRQTNQGKSR